MLLEVSDVPLVNMVIRTPDDRVNLKWVGGCGSSWLSHRPCNISGHELQWWCLRSTKELESPGERLIVLDLSTVCLPVKNLGKPNSLSIVLLPELEEGSERPYLGFVIRLSSVNDATHLDVNVIAVVEVRSNVLDNLHIELKR